MHVKKAHLLNAIGVLVQVASDGGTPVTLDGPTQPWSGNSSGIGPATIVATWDTTGYDPGVYRVTVTAGHYDESEGLGHRVSEYVDVTITGTCERFGQGYWKNHTDDWPDGYDPEADFFDSGDTWIGILEAPAAPGDAYIQLAYQYIAAVLNVANGCTPPDSVEVAIDDAEDILTDFAPGDLTGGSDAPPERADAETLKDVLDDWNNPDDEEE